MDSSKSSPMPSCTGARATMRERGLGLATGAGWGELGLCTARRICKVEALGLVTGINETTKLMLRATATDGALEGLMMQENRMAVTRPNRLDGRMRSEHSMISVRSAKLAGRRHRVGRCVRQCQ